jgi:hypothetical protein
MRPPPMTMIFMSPLDRAYRPEPVSCEI